MRGYLVAAERASLSPLDLALLAAVTRAFAGWAGSVGHSATAAPRVSARAAA
jgi:hypothetical protein